MTMSVYLSDDIYYVCCMIEYASRKTKNERRIYEVFTSESFHEIEDSLCPLE